MTRIDELIKNQEKIKTKVLKKYLRENRVKVDGKVINKPSYNIDAKLQNLTLDDKLILGTGHRYIMLNKPAKFLSANKDLEFQTVFDILGSEINPDNLYIVGRLDYWSRGLMLITDNGKLGRNILNPQNHVEKVYEVKTKEELDDSLIERFAEGLIINEATKLYGAKLDILTKHSARVTIRQGKNKQIRKMFLACGILVTDLKRLKMGPLTLDENLDEGDYRSLTDLEILSLVDYFN
jgi:pseudouridine synthase